MAKSSEDRTSAEAPYLTISVRKGVDYDRIAIVAEKIQYLTRTKVGLIAFRIGLDALKKATPSELNAILEKYHK